MKLALAWLLCLILALVYLGERWQGGITLRSDLLALLPDADNDPAVIAAKTRLTEILGQRVVVLIGDRDRDTARRAGDALAEALQKSGAVATVDYRIAAEALRRQGQIFFAHRAGLLSADDRARLLAGKQGEIAARALATVFGPVPVADANLLRQDPYLLFPAFLAGLPSPVPSVQLDDGIPTVRNGDETYVLLTVTIGGNASEAAVQKHFVQIFDAATSALHAQAPNVTVLRLGSVFYFAAESHMAELQTLGISILSLLGTIALILLVFRSARPLWLLAIAITSGIACAFSVSLWWFGTLHVLTLTFGASLIGIAIDYCLQYLVTRLSAEDASPAARLRRVLPAIFFGFLTTMIGYATLMATPFPGLREIAGFSAVGLTASFVTLILWFPLLDRGTVSSRAAGILVQSDKIWRFWETPRSRVSHLVLLALAVVIVIVGAVRLRFDDDIRRFQTLPRDLQSQEAKIRALTGLEGGSQFLIVRAPNDDAALEEEERLAPLLDAAVGDGYLKEYQSISRIIPSPARQADNRRLVQTELYGSSFAAYAAQIGLSDLRPPETSDVELKLGDIADGLPFSFLRQLVLPPTPAGAIHLVLLNGVTDFAGLRQAVAGQAGVTAVDPIGDITQILAEYRQRALLLLLLSAALMLPVLVWRYGIAGCGRVLLPPLGATIVAAASLAAFGMPFTFFTAMGLVLVLSIGFDYAIFCRETTETQKDVTMLGIFLAFVTTLLSFGLLAFSGIFALRSFGLVLFIGTILAFVLSPLARKPQGR
ncbi:MAG TPA: MMPL family transporter [Stellaceae bacterium]|nr:MMPL family transporter [Stellaceae bacterium]